MGELALGQPAADIGGHGRRPVLMVDDDESQQGKPLGDDQAQVARTGGQFGGVVMGDRPAHGHPAVGVKHDQGRLQVVGAHVVEVDVDAVRRGLPQLAETGPAL